MGRTVMVIPHCVQHLVTEDYATICGKQDVIELLLKEGADPNITNECGRTAMREA